jgi:hypothetical protein
MGPIVLALLFGVGAVFSLPPAPHAAQTPELPYVIESVSTYPELETGEPVQILLSVQDRIDTGAADTLWPNPIEIRSPQGIAVITPIFRQMEPGIFEAWVEFRQHGAWRLVLYPQVPENQREWLPAAIPTEQQLSVVAGPTDWLGAALVLLMAAGLFVYLGPTRTDDVEPG